MSASVSRRVFVIGAYIPSGGTYMAYHVGRILQLDFDFEAIAVQVNAEAADHGIHRYDVRFPSMSLSDMEAAIGSEDVLVCNPSFSSYLFGLRLSGRKICYVQGFNTFVLLDLGFDHYVAVSGVVSRFLKAVYDLTPSTISPFINLEALPPVPGWWQRPAGSILVWLKGEPPATEAFMARLRGILALRAPDIALDNIVAGITSPQTELLRRIGHYRYFLTLSPAEGFGLVPLEAMAMGATVIGFDGYGGRDYMRPGVNCAVCAYPNIETVADRLIALIRAPKLAAELAEVGRATAMDYTYKRFRSAWIAQFGQFLQMKPRAPQVWP